ncbi:hypothetical protein [Pontibacillus sp. HMF3514]|uniref:hypothetical protein n=1 Tax=Pontibacillus sp. HMF3514 TaxID=2692425 RepID=UPI00131F7724|nr:hypothetical protein [Pontibacillus sp. HMF3514]QHE52761.1 hypothetical protein GS400_12305 [Pontibacillus sp. HMF3514]
MFKIKYEIFEDYKEELSEIGLSTFDKEYNQVYGPFTIIVGEHEFIPYPSDDLPVSAKEIFSELILSHFELLNEVDRLLNNYDYVALKYIEDHWSWLEFVKVDEGLIKISELEYEIIELDSLLCINKEFLSGAKYGAIREIITPKADLHHEIKKSTKMFIEEIRNVNPQLLNSKYFSKIT